MSNISITSVIDKVLKTASKAYPSVYFTCSEMYDKPVYIFTAFSKINDKTAKIVITSAQMQINAETLEPYLQSVVQYLMNEFAGGTPYSGKTLGEPTIAPQPKEVKTFSCMEDLYAEEMGKGAH